MSSISSISSSGVDITQLLQRIAAQKESSNTNQTGQPDGTPPPDFENKFSEALTTIGVSEEDATTIQEDVKSAIASALDGCEESEDPREAIKAAIDDTLEEHGIDPAAVQEQFQAQGGPEGAGGPPPPPPDDSTSTDSSTSSTSTDTTESLLAQLLESDDENDTTVQLLQSLLPLLDATA